MVPQPANRVRGPAQQFDLFRWWAAPRPGGRDGPARDATKFMSVEQPAMRQKPKHPHLRRRGAPPPGPDTGWASAGRQLSAAATALRARQEMSICCNASGYFDDSFFPGDPRPQSSVHGTPQPGGIIRQVDVEGLQRRNSDRLSPSRRPWDAIHPQVRGTVTSCYLEVFAVFARLPLLDVAGPGVGAVGWTHASGG